MVNIKENVMQHIAERNMSIAELERTIKLANGAISKWDKQNPSIESLTKIADYFGVTIDSILGRTTKPAIQDNSGLTIYDRIKAIANSDGISIRELENRTGFSNGTINKWRISSPSINNVQKIADYFKVSIDFLIGRAGVSNNPYVELLTSHLSKNLLAEDISKILDYIDLINYARNK